MKKFSFALDSVLDYKNQALESIMGEHAQILAEVSAKEKEIDELNKSYKQYSLMYNEKRFNGITPAESGVYTEYLRKLEAIIKHELEKLRELNIKEEKKRRQVIEAKTESSSIEKLKDRRLEEYNKAVAKSEELFIEEFVSNNRVVNSNS